MSLYSVEHLEPVYSAFCLFQLSALFWEDPFGCDWDGRPVSQGIHFLNNQQICWRVLNIPFCFKSIFIQLLAFPSQQRPSSETVRNSLYLLTSSASRLHGECQKAAEHNPCPSDIQLVTQQVIQCAYDIAKAAKQLVTVTTKENNN